MKLSEHLSGVVEVGRTIAYLPSIARLIGVKETVFLCQIYFWSDKGKNEDGWIYKTSEEIEQETGLSYKEQLGVRHNLSFAGIIKEKNDFANHRVLFKPVGNIIDKIWNGQQKVNYGGGKWSRKQKAVNDTVSTTSECHCVRDSLTLCQEPPPSPYIGTEMTQESTDVLQNERIDDLFQVNIKKETKRKSGTSFCTLFKTSWSEMFEKRFGFKYVFSGGRDGKALSELEKLGEDPIILLAIAHKGWDLPDQFLSSQSQTIHGFYSSLVKIRIATDGKGTAPAAAASDAAFRRTLIGPNDPSLFR